MEALFCRRGRGGGREVWGRGRVISDRGSWFEVSRAEVCCCDKRGFGGWRWVVWRNKRFNGKWFCVGRFKAHGCVCLALSGRGECFVAHALDFIFHKRTLRNALEESALRAEANALSFPRVLYLT